MSVAMRDRIPGVGAAAAMVTIAGVHRTPALAPECPR